MVEDSDSAGIVTCFLLETMEEGALAFAAMVGAAKRGWVDGFEG